MLISNKIQCHPFFLLSPPFRIAANEPSFMSMQLKILDQRHKQKLNLKALDAVLFGPPLRTYAVSLTWNTFHVRTLNKTVCVFVKVIPPSPPQVHSITG